MDNFIVKLLNLDNLILNYVVLIQQSSFLDQLIPWIDHLAHRGAVWLFILLFLGAFNGTSGRKLFFLGIIAMTISWGLSEIIKSLVDRPRPYELLTLIDILSEKPTNSSFPSSQTAIAFAASTILFKNSNNNGFRLFVLLTPIIIGYSRIYSGVNYPLDIIGGAVLGRICAQLVIGYLNMLTKSKKQRRKYYRTSNKYNKRTNYFR